MIGWVNASIEAFIRSTFGDDIWAAVVAKARPAHVKDTVWVSQCPYPDAVTYDIVLTAAAMLGVTPAQALEAYGKYFVTYVYAEGYGNLLNALGDSLPMLLGNLDNLHAHLAGTYPNMHAPSFRTENVTPTGLDLHYTSARPALHSIVKGIVHELANRLFHHSCEMELVASRDAGTSDHEVYRVTYPFQASVQESVAGDALAAHASFSLSPAEFFLTNPFHILLDDTLCVLQVGAGLRRLFPETLTEGIPLSSTFRVMHPHIELEYNALLQDPLTSVTFAAHATQLQLRGSVLAVTHQRERCALLLLSPRVASLDALVKSKLHLADLSLSDLSRDYVLLAEQRTTEADLLSRFQRNLAELQAAMMALRQSKDALKKERERSDQLLYQMLPERVAETLRHKRVVEPVECEELTILFSDICGFSTIASNCSAREVCDMLGDLYKRFDDLIDLPRFKEAAVYKVETIGDAYMVVCNLEKPCADHADVILAFAAAMHEAASHVTVHGNPLRLRVGVHTGPAVGSVVGHRKPSFCLFGTSVNVASRIESTGYPGLTHVSSAAVEALQRPEEAGVEPRGMTMLKGLGEQLTYLCSGSLPLSEAPEEVRRTRAPAGAG